MPYNQVFQYLALYLGITFLNCRIAYFYVLKSNSLDKNNRISCFYPKLGGHFSHFTLPSNCRLPTSKRWRLPIADGNPKTRQNEKYTRLSSDTQNFHYSQRARKFKKVLSKKLVKSNKTIFFMKMHFWQF